MSLGPRQYPVVYDTTNGLQYVFESGPIGIDVDNNAITALTGDVSAAGPGSAAASISAATVTSKLLTGYVSGAGTVASTDTILQGINKLNGNDALKMPLAGGTFAGYLIAYPRSSAQRDATLVAAHLTSQGITYTSILDGTVGNSYSVTVIDSGSGGLAYTEPSGVLTIDLGGDTPSISDVVLLIGTTTPSAFVTVAGSGMTVIATHALQSLASGIQPTDGALIFNTDTHKLNVFSNGATPEWEAVTSSAV